MSDFRADRVVFGILVAVPILPGSVYFAASRALYDIARPSVLSKAVPGVRVLGQGPARDHDLVTVTVALFTYV